MILVIDTDYYGNIDMRMAIVLLPDVGGGDMVSYTYCKWDFK